MIVREAHDSWRLFFLPAKQVTHVDRAFVLTKFSDSFISPFSLLSRVLGNRIVPPFDLIFFPHFFFLFKGSLTLSGCPGATGVLCSTRRSSFIHLLLVAFSGISSSTEQGWGCLEFLLGCFFSFSFYLVATNEYSV